MTGTASTRSFLAYSRCTSLCRRLGFVAALLVSNAIWTTPSFAEEVSAENKAAARDLALEGIELAQAGQCDQAIGPLSRAEKLFHAPTILTWIGECQIQLGRYVEGTETLNRVVREKLEDDSPSAYFDAQKKAGKLLSETKPKIAKLTIDVAGPDGSLNSLEGLEVRVDGVRVAPALVGAARPSDPGEHVVEVIAPGYHPGSQTLSLEAGGRKEITLLLEVDPNGAPAGTPAPLETAAPEPAAAGGHGTKALGWGLIGAGGLFLVGGGITGGLAASQKGKLDCPDKVCPPSEEDRLKSARLQATLSTVFFGVGGAALVGGMVVLLTGRSAHGDQVGWEWRSKHVSVRPDFGWSSLGFTGKF